MNHTTDNEIRVELKYCERCGGLWFRRENSREVFCVPCTQRPSDALPPRHTPAPPAAHKFTGVSETGVNSPSRRDIISAQGPERAGYSQPGAQPRVTSARRRESRSDDCAPRFHLPAANNGFLISGGAA